MARTRKKTVEAPKVDIGAEIFASLRDLEKIKGIPVEYMIDRLKQEASFELWGPRGATETVVRFVTGWSTTDEDVDRLIAML